MGEGGISSNKNPIFNFSLYTHKVSPLTKMSSVRYSIYRMATFPFITAKYRHYRKNNRPFIYNPCNTLLREFSNMIKIIYQNVKKFLHSM